MPLICVPLQARSQAQALQKLKVLKGKADLAEIWLDLIQDLDLPPLLKKKPLPVLCRGKEALRAAKLGADYIDIPFSGKAVPHPRVKLILSHHDFKRTPSGASLLRLALRMRRAGADIVKIATFARSFSDTFRIIFLAQELLIRRIPHILIAMGKKGRLSRVLTPQLGGSLMFAPLKASESNAQGQLTLKELKQAWRLIKNS